MKKKISLWQFLPLSEAEIHSSFIQLKPVLDIFLHGFSLSSSPQQCEGLPALIPLAPKSHVF
jgi:hypothetical protein